MFSLGQAFPSFDVLPEPVDKWTNLNGTDLLQLIYDDPKRWGMAQVMKLKLKKSLFGILVNLCAELFMKPKVAKKTIRWC